MPVSRAAWTTAGLSAFMTPMLTTGTLSPVLPSVRMIGLAPAGAAAARAVAPPPRAAALTTPGAAPTAASPVRPVLRNARLLSSALLSVILFSSFEGSRRAPAARPVFRRDTGRPGVHCSGGLTIVNGGPGRAAV